MISSELKELLENEIKIKSKNNFFLENYFSENFAAKEKNYRQNLRRTIYEKLKEWMFFEDSELKDSEFNDSTIKDSTILEKILDLSKPLVKIETAHKTVYVSISHSQDLGGFVICSHPIGLDLETTHRIQNKTVERICRKEELELSLQDPSWLWPVKESIFKAMSPFQPDLKAISQITVLKLEEINVQTRRFEWDQRPQAGFGFIQKTQVKNEVEDSSVGKFEYFFSICILGT